MERLKLLERKLQVVKKQRELLMLEEAKLVRMMHQKRDAAKNLAAVRKERFFLMTQEARLLRFLKQNKHSITL
ncbi:hypothetical protein [Thermococcus sp.]